MQKSTAKSWLPLALAFVVPMALLAVAYALFKIEPFGPNSILFGDMEGQYVNFMAQLKELFGPGLFYTWHKALGGEALSFAAYYLFSPFNLLLLLFPTAQLSLGVVCLTLLKTGAAGLTMAIFLRARGSKNGLTLALSCAWALSGYMLGFAQNIMWLDGVILLPLVVLGLRRILEGKAPWLYLFSLSGAIFCCYYIGWMLCLFCAFYFWLHWLGQRKAPHRFKAIGRFIVASLLAGGLQFWMVAPVGLALGQGKAEAAMEWSFATNFSLAELPRQLLAGAYLPGQHSNQLPLIFCGTLPLLLALAALFCRRVRLAEKLASGALLAILLASFYWRTPDLIWHGLQSPSWFPYRYSFLFVFVVLELAALGGQALAQTPRRWFKPAAAVLCLALGVELFANSLLALSAFKPAPSSLPATVSQWQAPLAQAAGQTNDFYRVQYPDAPGQNTAFLLDYAGTAHYSSSYSADVYDLLGALGLSHTSGWAADSLGTTRAAASLLAVRYTLTDTLAENPYALPLAFAAAQAPTQRMATDVPFSNLENLYSALLGREAGIFAPAPFTGPELVGLTGVAPLYTVTDPEAGGSLYFTVITPVGGTLYAAFPVHTQYCGAEVFVNGKKVGSALWQEQNGTICLGNVNAGQTLTVELRAKTGQLALAGWSFAVEPTEPLAAAAQQLNAGGLRLQSGNSGRLEGSLTAPQGTTALFTSIPYEKGWRVWVDGQEVQPYAAVNALLAAPLTPGEHTVKLAFTPYGLVPGLAVSLASALCIGLWALARKRRGAPKQP